jgi:pimeloyl-ACP methyl ester carboxylesterase
MGGLVAMGFAIAHPDLTAGIVALDIAPRAYPAGHQAEFQAFRTDISGCKSRAELEDLVRPILPDTNVRQFILTNAVRDGQGFRWRLNVPALESATVSTDFPKVSGRFEGPALLIAAGRSAYVTPADAQLMHRYFPAAAIETIPHADHWLHMSAPQELLEVLIRFLGGIESDAINGRLSRP